MTDPKSNSNESTLAEPAKPVSQDVEELTSYLDGELTPVQMQAVEDRLAKDEPYRSEMQRLQKAWDMLDQLPRTDSSAQFTRSTIEMVVQNATFEVKKKNRMLGWITKAALLAGFLGAAFASGHWVTQYIQNSPQRELVRSLPLIENVDVYQKADNIEFLSNLSNMGLFDDVEILEIDPTLDAVLVDQTVHTIEQLKQLDVEKLDELRRKRNMFYELTPQVQQELRDFHSQVSTHENSEDLSSTMRRYYSWLKTLSDKDQIDLLDLPSDQRIERTRQMIEKRASDLFGKTSATELPEQDASTVYDWIKRTQNKKFEELVAHFQTNEIQEKLGEMRAASGRRSRSRRDRQRIWDSDPSANSRQRIWFVVASVDPDYVGNLVFEEIEELRSQLSQEALDIFERHQGEEQRRLVLNWILTATKAKQHVSDETLRQFYDEVLSAETRDEFDKMTPEDRRRQLRIQFGRYRERQSGEPPTQPFPRNRRNEKGEPSVPPVSEGT